MGYIEDFVNARLVRDAHVGVLWEGTSNIAALDAISRAVGKMHSHEALAGSLKSLVRASSQVPETYRARLDHDHRQSDGFCYRGRLARGK